MDYILRKIFGNNYEGALLLIATLLLAAILIIMLDIIGLINLF